jgi:hypothetical protein
MCSLDVNSITAYSTALAAFAGFCTALATIVLAYFNREYIKRVASQSKEIKKQTENMDNQYTLMAEKIELDRLEKKHERLTNEMKFLIAPMFGKIDSPFIWRLHVPAAEKEKSKLEHYSFWETIKQNMHYIRDNDLYGRLEKCFETLEKFRIEDNQGGIPELRLREYEHDFKNEIEYLHRAIKNRYKVLHDEITSIETNLEIPPTTPKHARDKAQNGL